MDFLRMARVKQKFDAPVLKDISSEISLQVESLGLKRKVRPGQTVAIACSSRGIANYRRIVGATAQSLRSHGLEPFIIPAMGSHGGATAEGQKRVLAHYGITEETIGVEIRSSLETVQIGTTDEQIPVYLDKFASQADHIVLINRVKSHTDFEYEIESGLMKLMAIGLGKQKGAAQYHQAFFNFGYPRIILSVANRILGNGKILFGVAAVENGNCQTAKIGVLKPEALFEREKELLREAKTLEPHLPFEEIDILFIDEMGKDISGAGIDTKIVGRIHTPLLAEEPKTPNIKRIIIGDLTEHSEGNSVGIGLADFVTQRLFAKINREATYMNALSGGTPEQAKIPLVLRNDLEALRVAVNSIGLIDPKAVRLMRIKNTKHLAEIEISSIYKKDLLQRPDLEVISADKSLCFDGQGNLEPF